MKYLSRLAVVSMLALAGAPLFAQNAALMPVPRLQFFDANGYPLAGGLVYTCVAGSSCPGTPLATYTDSTGGTQNPNPVPLDGGGFAAIWLGSNPYKIVVENSAGVVISTTDNVSIAGGGLISGTISATGVTGNFNIPGTLTAGTETVTASTITTLNTKSANSVLNAAQYAGSDLGAKVNAAIAACPSTGCEIDIPVASYTLTTPITVNKAGVWLHGQGPGVSLVQGFTGDLILVTADHFSLDAVILNGNGVSSGWSLIHGTEANYGTVWNCVLTDTRSPSFNTLLGIRIEGNGTSASNYWDVHNVQFISVPWIGVSVANNANHNQFHDNWLIGGGEAFDFNGVSNPAADNSFERNHVVGGFGDSFLESATGSKVIGNSFDFSSASTGTQPIMNVHLASSGSQQRSIISGNMFKGGTGSADCLNVYDNSNETLIDGNVFDSCGHNGIEASTGAGSVTNLVISNNVFHNNGVASSTGGYSAISAQQVNGNALAYWTVANNVGYDDQGTPSQTYGLSVTGTGAIYQSYIHGNNFSRNKTGAFNFSGGASLHPSTFLGPNLEASGLVIESGVTAQSSLGALHFGGAGNPPTGNCGAVAGTCTGVSVSGTDTDGVITFTTGTTTPVSGGTIFSLTFSSTWSSAPHCVIYPSNAYAAVDVLGAYVYPPGTSGFTIASSNAAYTSNAQHSYQYLCAN